MHQVEVDVEQLRPLREHRLDLRIGRAVVGERLSPPILLGGALDDVRVPDLLGERAGGVGGSHDCAPVVALAPSAAAGGETACRWRLSACM